MDLLDLSENTGLDDGGALSKRVRRSALVAHLGLNLVFGGNQCHLPGLVEAVGHRLLGETVFSEFHCHHAGGCVVVVGRTDGDGVDAVSHFLEHHAVIGKLFGVLESAASLVQGVLVNVADGHDISVSTRVGGIAAPLATNSHAGETNLLVRRLRGCPGFLVGCDPECGSKCCGGV